MDELMRDFANSYLRYLRAEQSEPPLDIDFPELTHEECSSAIEFAKAVHEVGIDIAPDA